MSGTQDHPAIALVTEEPTELDGRTYTARLTPGTNPPRWQVFSDAALGPVGYLEAVMDERQSDGWMLLVYDGQMRLIGTPGEDPSGRKDTTKVGSYANALHYIWARLAGLG